MNMNASDSTNPGTGYAQYLVPTPSPNINPPSPPSPPSAEDVILQSDSSAPSSETDQQALNRRATALHEAGFNAHDTLLALDPDATIDLRDLAKALYNAGYTVEQAVVGFANLLKEISIDELVRYFLDSGYELDEAVTAYDSLPDV